MTKNEIKKLIEEEKRQIAEFQKFAKKYKIPEDVAEEQLNLYLDTLNLLLQELEKANN